MPTSTEIARRYFAALAAHDLDAVGACWAPGAIDRLVGQQVLVGPDQIKEYFAALFAAFPDFDLEVLGTTTYRSRTAVTWRARGTFAGPGRFQGYEPNGARIAIEGCDVVSVADELISHNDAYLDSGDIARQLGLLPPMGSVAEARLAALANVRTRILRRIRGTEPRTIADGVSIVCGGFPLKTMNVFLIEDQDGVTVFDAGIRDMTSAIALGAARLGGIRRIVLGHVDADHRGAAPGLGAPVYCHPAEQTAALSASAFRDYWDLSKLGPHGRLLLGRLLPVWDGGALQLAGTVQEGETIAGFEVIDLPGHAPGLIGLWRERDRLALVSDCIYTLDPQTGHKGPARVPHAAFNLDTEQARASIVKLTELDPWTVWAGHADPVTGDVRSQLQKAASTNS
jgi:glyoxylase-like metal-dependent hydrolase (beta-lactamase superfamily II)/predicted ester cyclase